MSAGAQPNPPPTAQISVSKPTIARQYGDKAVIDPARVIQERKKTGLLMEVD